MSVYDEHLEGFEGAQRAALARTIESARRALPGAVEAIAWGMPTFRAGDASGPSILSITGFRHHNSLFPHSGSVPERLGDAVADYEITKGTIHFDRDRAFPAGLLRRIIAVRIEEINASYPRANGEFREYDARGALRTTGRMKGDARAGVWRTFRSDGSLLREVDHRGR